MTSILMSHMKVIKIGQKHFMNVLRVLITTICDIKIDVIMYEPHCVQLFFCEPHSQSCCFTI